MYLPAQPAILQDVPSMARHLFFDLTPEATIDRIHLGLQPLSGFDQMVLGLGQSLVTLLGGQVGRQVEELRTHPHYAEQGVEIPSTPKALWCWLQGEDRGDLIHRTRHLQRALVASFELVQVIDAFKYHDSRDLTGYEDGTENPTGEKAQKVAITQNKGEGLDGSSFVAVQQWIHTLERFFAMTPEQQDHTIGRRISDNEEIDEAPESAHVKRTAQESFDPEAFVLRRSMPWSAGKQEGLVFVAFGKSFEAYEALLRRMVGLEDGIVDALFRFTRPVTGSYFWCPPLLDGKLDLRAIQ